MAAELRLSTDGAWQQGGEGGEGGCTVAANDKHHVEAPELDAMHNLLHIRSSSAGTEDGATTQMNAFHLLLC